MSMGLQHERLDTGHKQSRVDIGRKVQPLVDISGVWGKGSLLQPFIRLMCISCVGRRVNVVGGGGGRVLNKQSRTDYSEWPPM
jgi:hypothetical protein